MEDILKTYDLTKEFKKFCAVKNLNMNIKRGDIYGFLGENGAGKTTTIRMIMGLVKSTSGRVELFSKEYSESDRKILNRIGSMIEYPGFYPNLTAYENLEIHRRMIGYPDKLFVIIGRETFSSAIIEAARFDEETNATLVGEMTSGKPNHYGSVRNFKLPNSKISIRYSTKHINIFKNQGNSLMPDVLKEVSIDDYINKKDAVLDYILQNS